MRELEYKPAEKQLEYKPAPRLEPAMRREYSQTGVELRIKDATALGCPEELVRSVELRNAELVETRSKFDKDWQKEASKRIDAANYDANFEWHLDALRRSAGILFANENDLRSK